MIAVAVAFGAAMILGGPGRKVETGIVVAVQATSLTSVEGFSIRTADGRTVAFRITSLENAATFRPATSPSTRSVSRRSGSRSSPTGR